MRVGGRFTHGPVRIDAALILGITERSIPTWGFTDRADLGVQGVRRAVAAVDTALGRGELRRALLVASIRACAP